MTQYLLTIYQPDGPVPPPEVLQNVMREVGAFVEETKSAGAWVFNGPLCAPASATVVRAKDGDVLTIDGPYVEAKEYIGGFIIVKASDLDGALTWGRKLARILTPLPIEVRPFRDR